MFTKLLIVARVIRSLLRSNDSTVTSVAPATRIFCDIFVPSSGVPLGPLPSTRLYLKFHFRQERPFFRSLPAKHVVARDGHSISQAFHMTIT